MMIRLFVPLCLAALILVSSCGADKWSNCAKDGDSMEIIDVVFIEQMTLINATYSLKRDVTNGTITMSINCGVLHCYTNIFGLCDDVKRKCPIKAGQGSLFFYNPIGNYKYGTFFYNINVTDQDHKELTCFNTQMVLTV